MRANEELEELRVHRAVIRRALQDYINARTTDLDSTVRANHALLSFERLMKKLEEKTG